MPRISGTAALPQALEGSGQAPVCTAATHLGLRMSLSLSWGVSAKFYLHPSLGVCLLTLPESLLSSGKTLPLNGKEEQSGTCPVIVINTSRYIPGV